MDCAAQFVWNKLFFLVYCNCVVLMYKVLHYLESNFQGVF